MRPRRVSCVKPKPPPRSSALGRIGCLESQAQAELDLSRRTSGGDGSEAGLVGDAAGQVEVRPVEEIEGFGAEIDSRCFSETEGSPHRQVNRCRSGSGQDVSAGVAEGEGRGDGECVGVEKALGGRWASARVADNVWAVGSGNRAGVAGVAVIETQSRRQRRARLRSPDQVKTPILRRPVISKRQQVTGGHDKAVTLIEGR